MSRLLVVAPGFHGYGDSIGDALSRRGYDVAVHRYDAVDSRARKAWNKLAFELPAKVRGNGALVQSASYATDRAITRMRQFRPDIVLVVRGDLLTPAFWDEASSGGRKVAVWLYDELRRMTYDPADLAQVARIATYSSGDAEALREKGIPALHVRTGFDDRKVPAATSEADGLVSFVGAPLPNRTAALSAMHQAGLPVHAWGRGWSDHPIDRARTWRLRPNPLPNSRDVPYDQALAIMRDSAATLNVHGDQDGFTMRTYEASAVGGVQLIDRPDVSELYEPGREILVFSGHDELVDVARRVVEHPGEFVELRRRARQRTLAEHTMVQRVKELEQLW